MSKKSEIQTQINTIQTGVLNPAATVRSVFGTESDSVLENIYADKVTESNGIIGNTITTETGNFSYTASFTKTGRKVRLQVVFANLTANPLPPSNIFTLQDTEYRSEAAFTYAMCIRNSFGAADNFQVSISNNVFRTVSAIMPFESYRADFTYNALD